MRRKAVLIGIVLAVFATLAIVCQSAMEWQDTSSLSTFTSDLARARRKAKGDVHTFAYHLTHFAHDAFEGKPWLAVRDELQKQGALIGRDFEYGSTQALIPVHFTFPSGIKGRPILQLSREWNRSTGPSSRMVCKIIGVGIRFDIKKPLDNKVTSLFPKDSILHAIFARPGLAAMNSKYPTINNVLVSYAYTHASDTTPSLMSSGKVHSFFVIEVRLDQDGRYSLPSTSVSLQADSQLEPSRKRFLSWLPFTFGHRGKPFLTLKGRDTLSLHIDNANFVLTKSKPIPQPVLAEAYTNEEITALPSTTKRLWITDTPGTQTDLRLLRRFTMLEELKIDRPNPLSATDADHILKLTSLTKLSVTVDDSYTLRKLMRMKSLTEFNVYCSRASAEDLVLTSRNMGLRKYSVSGIFIPGDKMIEGVLKAPRVRGLIFDDSPTVDGLLKMEAANRFKRITISPSPPVLSAVPKIRSLEDVHIKSCVMDSKTFREIARLPKLKKLTLTDVEGLDDYDLAELAHAKSLEYVKFDACRQVTGAAVMKLKAKLGSSFDLEPTYEERFFGPFPSP